jgi:hypothetical protein
LSPQRPITPVLSAETICWEPNSKQYKGPGGLTRSGSLLSEVDWELKFKGLQILLVEDPGIASILLFRLLALTYRPAHDGGSRDLLLASEPL